ncbi:MAG: M28 family peptidase [Arenicellales bacterium]
MQQTNGDSRGWLRWFKRAGFAVLILAFVVVTAGHYYVTKQIRWLPGESFSGAPTKNFQQLEGALEAHLQALAGEIGERSLYKPEGMRAAERYITAQFAVFGLDPQIQHYSVEAELIQQMTERLRRQYGAWLHEQLPAYPNELGDAALKNIWVEITGTLNPERLLVVGAHFDTVGNTPGANDNGSGIAGLLELARALSSSRPLVTVILVALSAEELPIGGVEGESGSSVFLDDLLERNRSPFAMVSLETMGFYSDEEGSQMYPAPLDRYYPSQGNFIAFVSDSTSRKFVRDFAGLFRQHAEIASQGATLPVSLVPDVLRSDHETYVLRGIPGLMVTDTANFRFPDYHKSSDKVDSVNIENLARVVQGLIGAVNELQ